MQTRTPNPKTPGPEQTTPEAENSCCGAAAGTLCGDIAPRAEPLAGGRSFYVSGLDCAEEVATLTKVLGPRLGGAEHLAFDVMKARMILRDGAPKIADAEVIRLVAKTGMQARPWQADSAQSDQAAHLSRLCLFTMLSGGFWAAGLLFHTLNAGLFGAITLFAGHGAPAVPLFERGVFLLAILFGSRLVAPKAWAAAKRLSPDMNLLMIVAIAGALVLGAWFEAATVAFLFSLSLYLEGWSVGRARNAVSALLDLAPPVARLLGEGGRDVEIPVSAVQPGQRIVVRAGERIGLDGIVVSGISAVDQAPITGESTPVTKEPDDEVYAGSINGEGSLVLRVTRGADQTMLARIIRMVGDAQSRRAEVEQWVTKFARIYTPAVMALAIAVAVLPPLVAGGGWAFWFYNALVLLVIACPCALVISTPVSIVAALASAARNGVLIKGGAYIEAPARLVAVALDKTGTITEGRPKVVALHPLGETSRAELLAVASALEARSTHPLGQAILEQAKADGLTPIAAESTRARPGRGVEGVAAARPVWLGSERFAVENGAAMALPQELCQRIERAGHTLVVVGAGAEILGILELRDRLRVGARQTIATLRAQGVRDIVMLTGDTLAAARAVAQEVGIDDIRAALLPTDKTAAIDGLVATHDMVAMVGDGVNDAPAMARAHIGIVMGAIGSDAAVETADIALMGDDLGRLAWLISHARRTVGIIRQNIGLALATKAVFAGLAGFGLASMWGAIAADVGVSLLVVANALRLLRIGPTRASGPTPRSESTGPRPAAAASGRSS